MVPLWGTTFSNPDSILFNFHWYLIKIDQINSTAHSEYNPIIIIIIMYLRGSFEVLVSLYSADDVVPIQVGLKNNCPYD